MPVHPGCTNTLLGFSAIELLVLGRERSFALGFFGMLAPRDGKVPSSRIEANKAGCRLKRLRMKDSETSLVPLGHVGPMNWSCLMD